MKEIDINKLYLGLYVGVYESMLGTYAGVLINTKMYSTLNQNLLKNLYMKTDERIR